MKTFKSPGITWHKASRSSGGANNCVELGSLDGGGWHAIRDSKNPDGPWLPIGHTAITTLLDKIKNDELG